MNVILIQPPKGTLNDDRVDLPLGLMYLSSTLKQKGHNVSILNFAGGHQHIVTQADLYGFSTYTPTYSWCKKKRDDIKALYPNSLMIAGGPHVSALPDECKDEWDAIVVGEGERGILEVISGARGVVKCDPVSIDDIPFPDYDGIDVDTYSRKVSNTKALPVLTSRGCPYNCAFCNSTIMGCGRTVRLRQPSEVANEIQWLKKRFDISAVRFVDDLFTMTSSRVKSLTQALSPLEITYRCNAKVNGFDKEMASLLKTSGCVYVSFGVESGSDEMLKRMNKEQTAQDALSAITYAKNAGITVRCFLMVGFPGETWETVNETISLMLKATPDEILVVAPIPYPGTLLYNNRHMYGITWISGNYNEYITIEKEHKSNYLFKCGNVMPSEMQEMREHLIESLSHMQFSK